MSERADRIRAHIRRCLRPIGGFFCWWYPFRYRQTFAVLLPDGMAIFTAALAGIWLIPYVGFTYTWLYILMLLLSPFVFLTGILIQGPEVKIIRLFGPIPYWVHEVPAQAKFDLYEAWEDPAPTGVGFGVDPSDPIHFGTTRSAEPLFRHVGEILGKAGWQHTAFGWQRP